MKALNAFIKPFEAPQKSVKKNFKLTFSLSPGLGMEGITEKDVQIRFHSNDLIKQFKTSQKSF